MPNPFLFSKVLKQHTPLIHFHKQEGATLRATELKPKFDKWLINKKGGWDSVPVSWKLKSSNEELIKALNYKVKVIPKGIIQITKIEDKENIPQFFANMGVDYGHNPKYFSETEEVEIQFHFSNKDFKSFAETQFPFFLAHTNFGARQNKAYGSFFIKGQVPDHFLPETPFLTFKIRDRENPWKDILNVINYYYQRLKSGVNYCYPKAAFSHYQPSFLKIYFANIHPGKIWEKRWLKEQFLDLEENDQEKYFVRAFLGLPYKFQFIPKPSACNENSKNEIYPPTKIDIDVSDPNKEIARVKSPITFKPIIEGEMAKIFILIEDLPQPLDKTFRFSSEDFEDTEISTPADPIDLGDLIRQYNISLGKSFTAFTFTGKPNYQVNLNP